MLRLLVLLLGLAAPVVAQAPGHGLLQNRSGLPLVFPLQVKTDRGLDYALLLADAGAGERVLSAYIEGGRFFRVLVPPGTFEVHIAAGQRWVDGDSLFGPSTIYYAHPEALTFGVRGISGKRGHLLDFRGLISETAVIGRATASRIALCPGGGVLPPLAAFPDLPPIAPEGRPRRALPIPKQVDRLTRDDLLQRDRGPDRLCAPG